MLVLLSRFEPESSTQHTHKSANSQSLAILSYTENMSLQLEVLGNFNEDGDTSPLHKGPL